MDAQKMTQEFRIKQWGDIFRECRNSDMTIKSWCAEQGINLKSYYYWQSKLRRLAGEKYAMMPSTEQGIANAKSEPVFTEVKIPRYEAALPAITVHISGAEIEIHNGADAGVIENTIRALRSIC
jgi:hypothetical protein